MGIRTKLMLPLVVTGMCFIIYLKLYWLPTSIEEIKQRIITEEHHQLSIIEPHLLRGFALTVPDEVEANIQSIVSSHKKWGSFEAFNKSGNRVYSYHPEIILDFDKYLRVEHPVTTNADSNIEKFIVYLDREKIFGDEINDIRTLSLLAALILIGAIVATIVIQNRILKTPLKSLLKDANRVANGKFDGKLDIKSDDEIGVLAHTFNMMKKKISLMQEELIDEKERALDSLNEYKQSESKLKTFFEHIPDGLMIINDNGEICLVNDVLADVTGYKKEQLQGKSISMILPYQIDDLKMRVEMAGKKSLKNGSDDTILTSESGRIIPVSITLNKYYQGDICEYICVVRDNTERLVQEQLLRSSEEKLTSIIESSNYIIYTATTSGMFTFLSPAWSQLLGYKVSEVLGQQHTIFIHPDDVPMCEKAFDEVVRNGDSFARIEYRIKHKKGNWRWHALSGSLVKDEDGDPLFFVGIEQDITEAKKAVEELKESEERLRLLFESMVQGIVLQGGNGEEIFSNRAVENILGMPHLEFIDLISSNSHLVVDENGYPFSYQGYPAAIALKNGVVVNDVTIGLLNEAGSRYHWVLVSSIPQFQKESERPYRVFTTFIDITERKEAEKTVQGYLYNLNVMDKVNQIGLTSTTIDEMLSSVLDEILGIFECDRVVLIFPCNPEDDVWSVQIEASGKEWSGIGGKDVEISLTPDISKMFEKVLMSAGVVEYSYRGGEPLPDIFSQIYFVKSQLMCAIYPKGGRPWILGIQYCGEDRHFELAELQLVENISNRLGDYITTFTVLDNLRSSEEQLKEAQEIARFGSWYQMINSGEVHWSDEVYNIFGKDPLWFTPKQENFLDLVSPSDRDMVINIRKNALEGSEKYSIDYRVIFSDESIKWIHEEGIPEKDDDGNLVRLIGTCQDITERKIVEYQLSKAEEQSRLILETAAEGIFGMDSEGRATFVNSSAAKMLGYESGELIKQNVHELINYCHDDGSPYLLEDSPMHQCIEQGEIKKVSHEMLWRKNGSGFFVEYTAKPIISEGVSVGAVVTFRDISELIEAENDKKLLQQQLQQAQKMDAIGQLTGGIAHDFNNMLASILGYSELALDLAKKQHHDNYIRYLEEISKAGERGRDLIDKMLAFSRGVDGAEPEPLLIEPLLHDVLKMLRSVIPSSIRINTVVEKDIPAVLMDTINLQQVIMNLCINARDAMGGKGQIDIAIHYHSDVNCLCSSCHEYFSGEYVEICIKDSGSGINKENINKLFDPFFTTKEVGKGTGMGLSVVHGILHGSNGHIVLDSIEGEGTTFCVYLAPTDYATHEVQNNHETECNEAQGVGRIMVVDDEPSVGKFLRELLETHGYEVSLVFDPTQARDDISAHPGDIDLVVSDVTMPGMTGIELASELRTIRPDLPVLLCSGYSDVLNDDLMTKIGVKRLLKKPLNSSDFIQAVKEFIHNK